MPIVTINVTGLAASPDGIPLSSEVKARLIAGVSQLLLDVLKAPLSSTFVVIEDQDVQDWGWGGEPVWEFRRRDE